MISTLDRPAWTPHGRSWAWGISVLAHGAALAWLLHALPPRHAQPDEAVRAMRFVLVAPVAPEPLPVPFPMTAARNSRPAAAIVPNAAKARAARPAAAAPPRPIALPAGQPEPAFTVAVPAAPGTDTGTETGRGFDMAAARGAARAVTAGTGPSAGQPLRETRDEKLGRAIDGARNGDCQTQYSGMGLLAIIPLAKDTLTGSGCKWK
jgi:hypothetical protein